MSLFTHFTVFLKIGCLLLSFFMLFRWDAAVYNFRAYLCEAGYRREAFNHSSVSGNAILMDVRTGHRYSDPGWPSTEVCVRIT